MRNPLKNLNPKAVAAIAAVAIIGIFAISARVCQNERAAVAAASLVTQRVAHVALLTPITEAFLESSDITCRDAALAQLKAYDEDPLAATATFAKYPAPVYTGTLAMLDTKTSPAQVTNFASAIDATLGSTGVNFAGKYTIVRVGLTGQGENYFMVDRETGTGMLVPYQIEDVDTRSDSDLLMIDPRSEALPPIAAADDPDWSICGPTSLAGEYNVDLRPFYYVWNGVSFERLGQAARMVTPLS